METKVCTKCKKILCVDSFHKDKNRQDGLYPVCKECRKEESRNYYKKNKDKIIQNRKLYYENNKDCISEKQSAYYESHREQCLEARKQYRQNNAKKISDGKKRAYYNNLEHYKKIKKLWQQNNRQKINQREKERLKTDPLYKLKHTIRCNIYYSFSRKKWKKEDSTAKIVGCDLDFLCNYLKGTYYTNYGVEYDGTQKVHIDHIIPLSTAKAEEDVYKLCHYTNLQLLNAEDNMRKRDKIDFSL